MKLRLLFVFILILISIPCQSYAVITCDGVADNVEINAAISAATDGDIIEIAAGTCILADTITWTNKAITVKGAGIDSTFIQSPTNKKAFTVNVSLQAKAAFRLTEFTFNGDNMTQSAIYINGMATTETTTSGWRVDHIKYDIPGEAAAFLTTEGVTWGLVDHCTINMTSGTAFYIGSCMTGTVENYTFDGTVSYICGKYNMSLPIALGTANAVYVEDCTFTATASPGMCVFDFSYHGGNIVFRRNTVTGGFFYSHWAEKHGLGAYKVEVYENSFTGVSGVYDGHPGRLEGGTGVIFNNQFVDYTTQRIYLDDRRAVGAAVDPHMLGCATNGVSDNHTWDGNVEATGWPCVGQIGRGQGAPGNQVTTPLYTWNNGPEATCITGGECSNTVIPAPYSINAVGMQLYVKGPNLELGAHSNGDYDYCIADASSSDLETRTCGNYSTQYVPYTYPHPLQGMFNNSLSGGSLGGGAMR